MKVVIFGSRILGNVPKKPKPTEEQKVIYEAARSMFKESLISLWKCFKDEYGPVKTVISGGASGIDSVGEDIARMITGKKAQVINAEWYKDGIKAGMIRNGKMADLADGGIYISLPGSVGTADMKKRLEDRGLPVIGYSITLDELEWMVPGISALYSSDLERSKAKAREVRNRNKN